jgi:hypothetical protein
MKDERLPVTVPIVHHEGHSKEITIPIDHPCKDLLSALMGRQT